MSASRPCLPVELVGTGSHVTPAWPRPAARSLLQLVILSPAHRASSPVSPVRMRMLCSSGVTKILPSPIFPVAGGATDRVDRGFDLAVTDRNLHFYLGLEFHDVFGATVQLRVAFLPAITLHLFHRHAAIPICCSASRTSSSLKGLMIAVIIFMFFPHRFANPIYCAYAVLPGISGAVSRPRHEGRGKSCHIGRQRLRRSAALPDLSREIATPWRPQAYSICDQHGRVSAEMLQPVHRRATWYQYAPVERTARNEIHETPAQVIPVLCALLLAATTTLSPNAQRRTPPGHPDHRRWHG